MSEDQKPQKQRKHIKMKQSIVVVTLLTVMTLSLGAIAAVQFAQFEISNETHIADLYATYKNNMDSCKKAVTDAKGDINKDCISPINKSIIGEWLMARDPSLIIND